jgi:sugar lactone lactonase YvrE
MMRRVITALTALTLVATATVAASVTPAAATTVEQHYTGSVPANGKPSVTLMFPTNSTGDLHLTLDWDSASADLNIFLNNPSGQQVAASTSATNKPEILDFPLGTTGTWKIIVKAKTGAANFTLDAVQTVGPVSAIVKPTHLRTIGGPGHAEMYPSGLDVDAGGTMYVADTGNDQVAAYRPDGTTLWRVGAGHTKALGSFANPRDIAYAGGKVYVADTANSRVQVLDAATGAVADQASWGPLRFNTPMGISAGLDVVGATVILVTEDNNQRVQIYNAAGSFQRTIGSGPPASSATGQFNFPRDAATDGLGNVFVADYGNDRVQKFSGNGTYLRSWGGNGSTPGKFKRPYGVAVDVDGNVYVADSNNERIQKFDNTGAYLASFGSAGSGSGQFFQLRRVAVTPGASPPDVFGADLWGNKAVRYNGAGNVERTYADVPPPPGGFNEPYGMTIGSGSVFVADTNNQRVQRFATGGAFQANWGERGFGETNSGFNWPRDITFFTDTVHAAAPTLWVADTKNYRLQEFFSDGSPTGRTLGKRGNGADQVNWPYAIAAGDGTIFLADTFNNRVQRWDPGTGHVVWTATGFFHPRDLTVVGTTVFVADTENHRIVKLDAADGSTIGVITNANIHNPEGIAVEPDGQIWLADTTWNRLVELSPTGVFLQAYGSLGSDNAHFSRPSHLEIATGASGLELYVMDQDNDRVQVYNIEAP